MSEKDIQKAGRWLAEHILNSESDGECTCTTLITDGDLLEEFKNHMRNTNTTDNHA